MILDRFLIKNMILNNLCNIDNTYKMIKKNYIKNILIMIFFILTFIKSIIIKGFNYCYIKLYNHFFGDDKFKLSTPNLFYFTIQKLNENTRILDFGCGSGLYYENNNIINLIVNKNLKIKGIDIDPIYIDECKNRIIKKDLEEYVSIDLINIFDLKISNEDKFDYIIFSESAPVLPEIVLTDIIIFINNYLLKDNGKIIFINNLSEENNIIKYIKPYLKYICLIDFGRLLTKKIFNDIAYKFKKSIEINLIESMDLIEILNYFKLGWIFTIIKFFGVTNYKVEQYEIILSKN